MADLPTPERDADQDDAASPEWQRFLGFARPVLKFLTPPLLIAIALLAGIMGLELLLLYYGWILFMFFHYRYLRQNELIYLLASAAQTQQPLPAALWAYLADRPRSLARDVIEAILLSAVFPGYWFWHRLHSFDHKLRKLVHLLEHGLPLSEALKAVPGAASREAVLAASVGETTGKLAETLRRVPRWRVATIWLDLMPRFLYPLFLLMTSLGIVSYLMVFIIPKFEKIFADFKVKLPLSTELLIHLSRYAIKYAVPIFLATFVLMGLIERLFHSGRCWYLPIVGRCYRGHVQSRLLKMLGLLLETGQPIPQALDVLIATGYFRSFVCDRLRIVRDRVALGGELADELRGQGLLPAAMAPLVISAQKMNNLPWALSELGDHQAKRTLTMAERFSMTVFPLAVIVVSAMIAFIVMSMFMPLLALLSGLAR